jgi:hypothetical protein
VAEGHTNREIAAQLESRGWYPREARSPALVVPAGRDVCDRRLSGE